MKQNNLQQNFLSIKSRITAAAVKSGRDPEQITLVAVSKKQPASKVQDYCRIIQTQSGLAVLGENYVQEFRDKRSELTDPFESHMIGPLQSNKVRIAVSLFDVIESVDSLKLAILINKEAGRIDKLQKIFLQVNVSEDPQKAGFVVNDLVDSLFFELKQLQHVSILGLMTITQQYDLPEQARADFKRLKQLSAELKTALSLSECGLSMGMSDDFEIAIEEGATHVRIGTALFGERSPL